jgi:hypothetical protein
MSTNIEAERERCRKLMYGIGATLVIQSSLIGIVSFHRFDIVKSLSPGAPDERLRSLAEKLESTEWNVARTQPQNKIVSDMPLFPPVCCISICVLIERVHTRG